MADPRFSKVAEIVAEALEHPTGKREHFVRAACGDDETLLHEVQSLLQQDQGSGGFLETPTFLKDPARNATADPWTERVLGPWRITRRVAVGGMGTVYEARRHDGQFDQRVAVKFMHRSGSDELLRRFEEERRLLARLEHPSVARLLDGGVTAEGSPYLVMEFVDGRALDRSCDEQKMTVPQRLHRFLDVCEAVDFAHRNLIVHRDLKPSNVLVTDEGDVKLLDFGIAKVLETDPHDGDQTTASRQILTPQYAAPEQVLGRPVSVGADVYALGVMLYELLTGRRPYDLDSLRPAQAEQVITETIPDRPSQVVLDGERATDLAARRGTTVLALSRALTGDLDWVVMQALRKEPERRYPSVAAFADDLRRHLDGWPVHAGPDTVRYRTGKFLRRHRTAVVAGSMTLVSLIVGLAISLHLYFESESQRQRADVRSIDLRDLATRFAFDVDTAVAGLDGSTPVRGMIVDTALEHLERLSSEASDDLVLHVELARAFLRAARVLGDPDDRHLGRHEDALRALQRSKAHAELVLAAQPDHLEAGTTRVITLVLEGRVQSAAGHSEEAWRALQEADRARQELERRHGSDESLPSWSMVERRMGQIAQNTGRFDQAFELLQRSYESAVREAASKPHDVASKVELMGSADKLAEIARQRNDDETALRYFREARDLAVELADGRTPSLLDLRAEGLARLRHGRALSRVDRLDDALDEMDRAEERFETLTERDRGNLGPLEDLGYVHHSRGQALLETDLPEEAIGSLLDALDIRTRVVRQHGSPLTRFRLASTSLEICRAYLAVEDPQGALEHGQVSRRHFAELAAQDPGSSQNQLGFVLATLELGRAAQQQASWEEDAAAAATILEQGLGWLAEGHEAAIRLEQGGGVAEVNEGLLEAFVEERRLCQEALDRR